MARLPQPGADAGSWGDILNEYLLQAHTADGRLKDNSIAGQQLVPGTVSETHLSAAVQGKLNAAGQVGATGATGPQGPAGPSGPQGAIGASGAMGPTGAIGATGATGPQGNDGVPGPSGATGATGPQGAIGATGPAGATTIDGISGLQAALDAKINITEKAVANGVATLDANAKVPLVQIPAAPITKVLPYSYLGTLSVSTGTFRLYNDSGSPWTIVGARATVAVAPVGAAVIIDVNKNGTTIFTNQANRPVIADGATSSGKVSSMDVTTVSDGEYLTVDIDQVGVSTSGNDLVIQLSVA